MGAVLAAVALVLWLGLLVAPGVVTNLVGAQIRLGASRAVLAASVAAPTSSPARSPSSGRGGATATWWTRVGGLRLPGEPRS